MSHSRLSFVLLTLSLVLTACGGSDEFEDTVTFTAEDAAEVSAILDRIEGEQEKAAEAGLGDVLNEPVVLDVSQAHRYASLRSDLNSLSENAFRVTNIFLNVREAPTVGAKLVEQLGEGDRLSLIEFPNARWAHVQLDDGRKGYVSSNYIAQVVTDEQLAEIKKKYKGLYEVNFRFLNVRNEPSTKGQKLGELTAHQIIKPEEISGEWAKLLYEGNEGYVSSEYLRPYEPKFLVRQDTFRLPILHYRGDDAGSADALVQHLAYLKSLGKRMWSLRDFYDLLLLQEERDVRVPDEAVVLVISEVTATTVGDIADALRASGVKATFFLSTAKIGPEGISPQTVRTLISNGHDVQSAGHTGDDLRSLTNSQVALDLAQSRQILEDLSGREVFAISYPRGGTNDRVAEQAIETGYLFGITLTPSLGEHFSRAQFLKLPSNSVTATTTEGTLKGLVE